ncbi:hypothetical protein BACCAP_01654 [Pseudoflavonifractor capillosus ATCC 29799]|uniref:Uncharacterized protein n=1 Tax=Pseudoflavonifractor capillosus ATCC 29799 TaxID=411467 RepID=A6NTX4_9FIRM|nr:hypothetical protein [Pseudoflavonifractor capillosus]EDN00321.1 hypothetical protein BACCAP_01654 [Pseudoflavonifractor capillosus ATCC 29799]
MNEMEGGGGESGTAATFFRSAAILSQGKQTAEDSASVFRVDINRKCP